mmetsp:Transcript_16190/g.34008  ORF Transcript_16190/g.34008 Transcript_16190/m.34008 type:complete len:90 (-) Transcript_16190:30-299(-)
MSRSSFSSARRGRHRQKTCYFAVWAAAEWRGETSWTSSFPVRFDLSRNGFVVDELNGLLGVEEGVDVTFGGGHFGKEGAIQLPLWRWGE